jgi:hypothetical protein
MRDDDPSGPAVSLTDWRESVGASERQVRRWLAAGQIPGAALVGGVWWIPADAPRPLPMRPDRSPGTIVRPAPATAVAHTAPLGHLGSLDDAAAVLGTTVGGVRRMAADGLLTVGRYGPRGALRVYLPPR